MHLEDSLDLRIPDADAKEIHTLGDAVAYVLSKVR